MSDKGIFIDLDTAEKLLHHGNKTLGKMLRCAVYWALKGYTAPSFAEQYPELWRLIHENVPTGGRRRDDG